MSRRPEILFPLFADLKGLDGVGPRSVENFAKMGVEKPGDLLFTLPHNLIDRNPIKTINDAVLPSVVTVEVTVGLHQPNAVKGRPYRVMVEDAGASFQLVFFHARKDWLQKQLPSGQKRIISGKLEVFDGLAQMVHPDYILTVDEADSIPPIEPVYPMSAGITQKLIQKAAKGALARVPDLPEWIEPSVLKKHGWPSWKDAVLAAHAPQSTSDLSREAKARERLAYDEFLAHQTTLAIARANTRRAKGIPTLGTGKLRNKVLASLPYKPTGAQSRSIDEITTDMADNNRMNRLLQGDVGAGKTLVAFMAMLAAVEAGAQGVMMAPTEILARQHLAGLQPLAEEAGVVLEILTGRDKGKERTAKLKALADGNIHILVGTHAVFQKDVEFSGLRIAVIDEQHRFGVRQRMDLGAKGDAVDVLVMTATPIPRSLELSHYGDMDVSVLDEKPPGRKPITTVLVSNSRMDQVVDRLKAAIAEGKQAYWVCPLVEESELVDHAAAEDRFRTLRLALGDENVGLVHGQMPVAQKDAAMAAFIQGETSILVATTVIEVGVDVPNASIMVIEQAEHFGLAQLHQLRGRVGRGTEASTCLLMYASPLGKTAERRLTVMRETEDGFRISEEDLKLRGAGDLLGTAQSGVARFRVGDLEAQTTLMKIAHDDARLLIHEDAKLQSRRGNAVITLLYLLEHEKSIRLLSIG
ncbi:ATP-dependent DNA helicase RecG [Amylibacter sp. SFDW26]|uniref:ATP-dependent DNA helicase RecG n=1 Tax=Amylibacter sp. SFDW26 TaxID=2652722 RepID=UPI0012624E1C|nr:ATP-dependent DNA helicase RecG [Amylibacter sp. SFDW26]KAB7615900.1 ATP-dependent DNA helicase RecG [Amylibacter sp. SFDW26]